MSHDSPRPERSSLPTVVLEHKDDRTLDVYPDTIRWDDQGRMVITLGSTAPYQGTERLRHLLDK